MALHKHTPKQRKVIKSKAKQVVNRAKKGNKRDSNATKFLKRAIKNRKKK